MFYIPGAVGEVCYPVLHPFDLVDPVLSLEVTLFQDLQVSSCVGPGRGLEELPLGLGYEVYIISERGLATVLYETGDKLPEYPQYCVVSFWGPYTDVGVYRPLFGYAFLVYSENSA